MTHASHAGVFSIGCILHHTDTANFAMLILPSPSSHTGWHILQFTIVHVLPYWHIVVEFGEAIKNPAYRILQTEYSGCLDISAHA